MSDHRYHDLAASVRQRLLNLAHRRAEPFDLVLTRYAQERLLYRLGQSESRNAFLLKGVMLFAVWYDQPHRPTRDLDLLGFGANDIPLLEATFQSICRIEANDGTQFLADTVRGVEIREANIYTGVRIKLIAQLAGAKIPLQIDIGFGDAVTPAPEPINYPTLLDFPAPQLNAYPHYSVVSEKLQAIVLLGIANSRMKDFYDIWSMARRLSFKGSVLCQAIEATLKRRDTILPESLPLAFTDSFANDPSKNTQWNAFIRKNQPWVEESKLSDVLKFLKDFLMLPLSSLIRKNEFTLIWNPGGPWK